MCQRADADRQQQAGQVMRSEARRQGHHGDRRREFMHAAKMRRSVCWCCEGLNCLQATKKAGEVHRRQHRPREGRRVQQMAKLRMASLLLDDKAYRSRVRLACQPQSDALKASWWTAAATCSRLRASATMHAWLQASAELAVEKRHSSARQLIQFKLDALAADRRRAACCMQRPTGFLSIIS